MKNYSSAINNYRDSKQQFYAVNIFAFQVYDPVTHAGTWYYFSSRDENETFQVIDPTTGALHAIDCWGGGQILGVDPLIRSGGTTIRNLTMVMNGASQQVRDMVQGYDCRAGIALWYIGEVEENTGLLVDNAALEFEGFIDTIDFQDSAVDVYSNAGAQSSFSIVLVSHISTLQGANPDMRSYEIGQERSGDEIFLHTDAVPHWTLLWGKEGKNKKRGGGSGEDGHTNNPNRPDPYFSGR